MAKEIITYIWYLITALKYNYEYYLMGRVDSAFPSWYFFLHDEISHMIIFKLSNGCNGFRISQRVVTKGAINNAPALVQIMALRWIGLRPLSYPMVDKQRVLMHGHQGWNVRHGLCHIYMIYVYIWAVYSFCLFCCLFIIVTTQFVALYKLCKPKPSTYDPPDNHPLAEIQRPILRPEPKQQICHQHANTDHLGK